MLLWLEKNRWLSWLAVFLIAIMIFYISNLAFAPGPPGFSLTTYFYHFLAFFWLAFFMLIAVIGGRKKELLLPIILVALVYAVSDEFHQLFVFGRTCSFKDFLIDSAGIFTASLVYVSSLRRKIKRSKLISL